MRYDSAQAVRRFVDGELSAHEQSLFLAYCESDIEQYRALALALVERDRMQASLIHLETIDPSSGTLVISEPKASLAVRSMPRRQRVGRLAAIAATVLLAAGVGLAGGYQLWYGHSTANIAAMDDSTATVGSTYFISEGLAGPSIPVFEPLISEEVREEFRQAGIEIKEEGRLLYGIDDQGRAVSQPNRKIQIKLVKHNQ